jgi:hypothetical protein
LSRLFISHSSKNDDFAIALKDWLIRDGWSGPDDIFLDLDPERGIAAGQRWVHTLEDAATRCEAVLFLVSEDWLASKWCADEYQLANRLNKKLFALLIDDIAHERLPGGLTAQWQMVRLRGEPAERFLTVHPLTQFAPRSLAQAEPLGCVSPSGQSRGGTPEGVLPLPFPPPLAGEDEGGGSAAARKAAVVTEQRLTAFRFLFSFVSFVARVE